MKKQRDGDEEKSASWLAKALETSNAGLCHSLQQAFVKSDEDKKVDIAMAGAFKAFEKVLPALAGGHGSPSALPPPQQVSAIQADLGRRFGSALSSESLTEFLTCLVPGLCGRGLQLQRVLHCYPPLGHGK